ncbi:MAG: GNAT family N-acetyltransferase [Parvularculaceae bacterium]
MTTAFILRPFDPDRDGPALHAVFGDEESCLYLPSPATKSIAETVELLRKYSTGLEKTSWAVAENEDSIALGRIALIPRERDIYEAACMICPAARGLNFAARALARVIDEAFSARGARRIFADIDPDNPSSVRTFEKLGFRHEGVLRGNWLTHIGERDSIIMGLLRDDPRPWRRA